VTGVPELEEARRTWTVGYLEDGFARRLGPVGTESGYAETSKNNFFIFFNQARWIRDKLGPYPTEKTNWSFGQWASHARRADEERLPATDRHYYFQAGVDRPDRAKPEAERGFISRDLPSFSGSEPTLFNFDPSRAKGMQCRFGERGVTAASHYDGGRNMVAMVHGAKRYILSPPKACKYLAVEAERSHPGFRHSMLNFGRMSRLDGGGDDGVPGPDDAEQEKLRRASAAPAVETVLRRGEVLYIPSFWFHYITSLQMSAQCNTRSGREEAGATEEFGGQADAVGCK